EPSPSPGRDGVAGAYTARLPAGVGPFAVRTRVGRRETENRELPRDDSPGSWSRHVRWSTAVRGDTGRGEESRWLAPGAAVARVGDGGERRHVDDVAVARCKDGRTVDALAPAAEEGRSHAAKRAGE